MTQLYDVVIYEKSTGVIVSVIGKAMRKHTGEGTGRNTADLRVQTGRERCNDRFTCTAIPAGVRNEGQTIDGLEVSL